MNMKKAGSSSKLGKAFQGRSPGFTLIEVLVALGLFAIIGIVFAGGLATASRSVITADIRTNAESLARTEMEYVKSHPYHAGNWTYVVTNSWSTCTSEPCPDWLTADHTLSAEHALYTVEVDAEPLNESESEYPIEEITVTVSHEGRHVITLVGYRINR
jgi:prepilin-type N-terminal cleavage/methylation domain-containing protein